MKRNFLPNFIVHEFYNHSQQDGYWLAKRLELNFFIRKSHLNVRTRLTKLSPALKAVWLPFAWLRKSPVNAFRREYYKGHVVVK